VTADIRTLEEISELQAVCDLFGETWPTPQGHPPTTVGLLKALAHTGNYVSGAFRDGRMIGAAVAFLGLRQRVVTLFSNQIAVDAAAGGQGVGMAIQCHMRGWALEHDIHEINWTFDPLMVRNAYFFINKVGARGVEYLPDFYGGSYDPGNDASDRIFAVWDLRRTRPESPPADEAPLALFADASGAPAVNHEAYRSDRFAIRPPADIKALRRTDSALANLWRERVRQILGSALDAGYRLVDVSRDGRYVIAR